jgi:glycosyltransferase involved in cell wall biosynthesis
LRIDPARAERSITNEPSSMLSFIVPAYNEETLLAATLEALHAAARAVGEAYEVVVVDDGSTDCTASIARRHGASLVSVAHRQIAATRNAGARAANGDWFIFVDADTIVDEAVVRATVDALRGGAVAGGAAVAFDGPVPLYARLLLPVLVRWFRLAGWAAGCYLFCTREAFVAVGGFDERFYGAEELVISRALKRQGRFVVLRRAVTTSGRKMRTHSVREMLTVIGRLALRGSRAVMQRQGMELWYAERRDDPQRHG